MIVHFFRNNPTLQLILIFLLSVLLWLPSFISPNQMITGAVVTPVYNIIFKTLYGYSFLQILIAYILLLFNAILLNNIYTEKGLLPKNNYLIAMVYIVLMSYSSNLQTLNPVLISNVLIILSLYMLIKTFDSDDSFQQILNASVLLSVSSFIYFPSIIIFFLIWISFIVYRTFSWREWLISLTGFLIPYILVTSYLFLTDKLSIKAAEYLTFVKGFQILNNFPGVSIYYYIFWSFIALVLIITFYKFISSLNEKLVSIRKHSIIIIWLLIFSIAISFTFKLNYIINGSIIFLPLSIIIAQYFSGAKKMLMKEIMFTIIIAIIILIKI